MNSSEAQSSRYWASILSWVFQIFTLVLALVIGYLGDITSFFVIIIPSAVLFCMTCSRYNRDQYALLVFKLMIMVQALVLYTSAMSSMYKELSKSTQLEIHRPLNVHNSYGSGYVKEISPDEMVTGLRSKGKVQTRPLNAGHTKHKASEEEYSKGEHPVGDLQGKALADHIQPAAPPKVHVFPKTYVDTKDLVRQVFGSLPDSTFDDLKHRSREEVRSKLKKVFEELPQEGFLSEMKNPCWEREKEIQCLPYVYLLGQPKCGTSDLYERIIKHQHVVPPRRKEVRWFTRGEFSYEKLPEHQRLNEDISIYSFTDSFRERAVPSIIENPSSVITIDGGPHTLWWPTQEPDGSLAPEDIPTPQVLREMQPNAKFIITLCDPVKRMWSDYNFLGDDLKPVKVHPGKGSGDREPVKSAKQFATRSLAEVTSIKSCINSLQDEHGWFRASQICAHDRHKFAVGGHGRIAISLYVLFIEKWLEHFSRDQFLIMRLEDYHDDPAAHMRRIFKFLELDEPDNWNEILTTKVANKNRHGDMLPETEAVLREFFQPYNDLLASLTGEEGFYWTKSPSESLNNHVDSPSFNRHGAVAPVPHHELSADKENIQKPVPRLRHGVSVELNPKSFDISHLNYTTREEAPMWSVDFITKGAIDSESDAGLKLCAAAVAMDTFSLKYLLYEIGVSANSVVDRDHANAFHCMAMLHLLGDANSKSHVFNVLKGKESWLSKKLHPPLQVHQTSIMARDIIYGMEKGVSESVAWLIAAGTDPNYVDSNGNTPLHVASSGGMRSLVHALLSCGGKPNLLNRDRRSPLHIAASHGHAEIVKLLRDAGGDMTLADKYGATAFDIASMPGPILASDAKVYLGIDQRPPRKIEREAHPENTYWSSGGWGVERMKGFENDMSCDVDQYLADEITGEEIFSKYIAKSAPILIRGLIGNWPAVELYKKDKLMTTFGDQKVHVSSIPYSQKFGGSGETDMDLKEYISEMVEHRLVGGAHPWYIFKGHPIPKESEKDTSFVKQEYCPTPEIIESAFGAMPGTVSKQRNDMFVNAQWALGGEGTGAPVHFHNTAWNALVYGAKRWLIYPPHYMMMSSKQILDFFETDMKEYEKRGFFPRGCTQVAGDVMIIPESWAHGVLNIQESVAVATEAKNAMWRIKPIKKMMDLFPDDNRNSNGPNKHRSSPH